MRHPWLGLLLAGACVLAAPPARAAGEDVALRAGTCSFTSMLQDLRAALRTGSPALQRYTRTLIKEAALAIPPDELLAALEQERDPAVLEALGAALATKSSNTDDPRLVRPLLSRAVRDADPRLRAAAVRGLRGTGSVDILSRNADVASYEQLIRDPSPEVRQAAAENITEEDAKVYFGHYRPVTEAAVATAAAAPDPELAARLLRGTSMEQATPESVTQLTRQLRSDSASLRSAAAFALGGVPTSEAQRARDALVELYRGERDASVRRAVLQSIARLGFAGAVPVLESLREVDPSMGPEIDAWVRALRLPVREWSLLEREKQRLLK